MPNAYFPASILEGCATAWVMPMRNTCLSDPKVRVPPTFFLQGTVASAATSLGGAALGDMVLAMVLAASCPPYSYPFFICGSCSILFQKFSFSHTPLKKFFFLLNQPELVSVV